MRLRRLDLIAFGPFAGEALDFGAGEAAMHVVHGPNEAGKSTTLRALTGLLYGIPSNTPDAHRHALPDLRVGGLLVDERGRELAVVRRKGSKNTLLDSKGKPCDPALLERLLGGVGQEEFLHGFGLDHERLREGGEALARGSGLAEVLYQAASGSVDVRPVVEALRTEADELYKARGRKPAINLCIADIKKLEKQLREQQQGNTAAAYGAQRDGVESAKRRLHQLEQQRAELRARLSRLRVVQILCRRSTQLAELRSRVEALSSAPRLSPEAGAARLQAMQERGAGEREAQRLRRDLEAVAQGLTGLSGASEVEAALLELSDERMAALQDRLGSHRKAIRDLPAVRGELRALEDDVVAELRELGRDDLAARPLNVDGIEALRPDVGLQSGVREHEREHALLRDKLAGARQRLAQAEVERGSLRERLEPSRSELDRSELQVALRRGYDVLQRVREAAARLEAEQQLEREVGRLSSRLGLAERPLGERLELRVPAAERVQTWVAEEQRLEQQRQRRAQQLGELEKHEQQVLRDLDALERAGHVPSEAELVEARQLRDESWRLLRAALSDEKLPAPELVARVEATMQSADRVSERLYREAGRVERRAQLQAERASLERDRARVVAGAEELDAAQQVLDRELAGSSQSLGVVAGRRATELTSWLRQYESLVEAGGRLLQLQGQAQRLAAEADAAKAVLRALLDAAADVELPELVVRGEARVSAEDEAARQRSALDERLQGAVERCASEAREVQRLEQELDTWQQRWASVAQQLGLSADAEPRTAAAVVERLQRLFTKLGEWQNRQRRVSAMERDADSFQRDVHELCSRAAPDLESLSVEDASEALLRRQRQAQQRVRERAALLARQRELERELSDVEHRRAEAVAILAQLCERAGVQEVAELEEAERRSAERDAAEAALSALEAEIDEASAGFPRDELLQEAAATDRGHVGATLESLDDELEELSRQIEQAREDVGRGEQGLERFERSDAAELQQRIAVEVARLREQVRRYVSLRLAHVALSREMERYRQQHQGPVITRARDLFPRLTLGRYRDLRVDFDARDEPVLRAVRKDGTPVDLTGLSTGTRDQLFLALRVATIERFLASEGGGGIVAQPLPVVLDDVLIHFDPERARAALEVLGELALSTQVLFFTHNPQLVELAVASLPAMRLRTHDLAKAKPRRAKRAAAVHARR